MIKPLEDYYEINNLSDIDKIRDLEKGEFYTFYTYEMYKEKHVNNLMKLKKILVNYLPIHRELLGSNIEEIGVSIEFFE